MRSLAPIELSLRVGASERSITGHIDFLQVRNGAVHILDYKPDCWARKRSLAASLRRHQGRLFEGVFSVLQDLDHPVDHLGSGGASLPSLTKTSDQFSLPVGSNLSIARKCRQYLFVPEVLAPGLELFRRSTKAFTELRQRLAKRVRIGIRKVGAGESLLEDRSDRRGIRPMQAGKAAYLELVILVLNDLGCGKQGIDRAEKPLGGEVSDPICNDLTNVKVLENFVCTSRASCTTLPSITSTCLSFSEAIAPSRAPVSRVKATTARLRKSRSVTAGMVCSTCRICSIVGTGRSRVALAILASLSDSAKYSASTGVRCERRAIG
jgi:hypothetical protein